MKIGTDGVLLGAWTSLSHNPVSILDVGTGTGIIALQMAQRSLADIIDAVELDEDAYEQAVDNFEQSDWGDRLFCYNSSFEELANEFSEEGETYDLIVSNPPFYTDDYESENQSRNIARFTSSLSFQNLIEGVIKILSNQGIFSVIIPFKEESSFVELSQKNDLLLIRRCRVRGNANSEIKRSLLEFSFDSRAVVLDENLTIETQRHQYTQEYVDLVKDFYLKM